MLSYFLTAMSNSLVITGLTKIQTDLSLNQVGLSWVQNAYGLAFGSFLLLSGRLSDVVNRRKILNIALFIFLIGSLLSGIAFNGAIMIAARFIQGIGSALLAPTSMALLVDYFSGPSLVKAIAWYSSVAGLGASIGLVLGGIFASFLSWRIGFYINVPVCLLMSVMSIYVLSKTSQSRHEKLDIIGTITSILGCGVLVYALNGAQQPLVTLIVALVLLAIFIYHESRSSHPILPLSIFKNWVRTSGYLCRTILNGTLLGYWFFISEYLQKVLHYNPLQVGFGYLPLSLTLFIAAVLVPRLINNWGNKKVLILASITMLIGYGVSVITIGRGYWLGVGIPMLIIGTGQGLALAPTTNMGIYDVKPTLNGTASGLVNVAHQLGGVLGLAIMVFISSLLTTSGNISAQFQISLIVAIVMMIITAILACLSPATE